MSKQKFVDTNDNLARKNTLRAEVKDKPVEVGEEKNYK